MEQMPSHREKLCLPHRTHVSAPAGPPALSIGQKLAGVYVLRRAWPRWPKESAAIWLAYDEVLGKDISLHFIPASAGRADVRAGDERAPAEDQIATGSSFTLQYSAGFSDLIEEADWAAISMDWFEGESVAALQKQKDSGFFEPGDRKPWLEQLCPGAGRRSQDPVGSPQRFAPQSLSRQKRQAAPREPGGQPRHRRRFAWPGAQRGGAEPNGISPT